MNILNLINKTRLLPLTTLTSREDVEPLCDILFNASIPFIEITLRDQRTLEIIDEFKKFPDIHLGIGTIRTIEHIDIAAEADASFLISPGFSESLANHAAQKNIPMIPGVQTPSEIINANEAGFKIFPSESKNG